MNVARFYKIVPQPPARMGAGQLLAYCFASNENCSYGLASLNRSFQTTIQDFFLHGVFATAVGCGKEREECPVKAQWRALMHLPDRIT